jgi:hypothetical protein
MAQRGFGDPSRALAELERAVVPRPAPLVLPPAWWSAVEAALGTSLPSDYKALVTRFGEHFGRGYHVFSPFASDDALNLHAGADRASRILREKTAREDPRQRRFPFRFYPQSGGLLSWGHDDADLLFFWLTAGEPEAWPTIVVDPGSLAYERFDLPVTGFLNSALYGRLHSRLLVGASPWPPKTGGPAN